MARAVYGTAGCGPGGLYSILEKTKDAFPAVVNCRERKGTGIALKIKTASMRYEDVLALPAPVHRKPVRQRLLFRIILLLLSVWDLWATRFTWRTIGLEKLDRGEPCLVLMNHSSFIDLKIAARLLFTRPFHIVCTSDGFVGKHRLYSGKKIHDGCNIGAGYGLCGAGIEEFRTDVSGGELQL